MAPSLGLEGCQGQGARAKGVLKTEMGGSSSSSSRLHPSPSPRHLHSSRPQRSSRSNSSSLGMIAGSSSNLIRVETKKDSEEDLLEIGWKMTGIGMGAVTTRERVTVRGESGEGGALTGTGTETWKTEVDALVGIETERETPEIGSLVERRKKTGGRRSPR